MKHKEKEIVLKEICSRIPYEQWVQYEDKDYLVTGYGHGRVSLLPSVFSSIGGPCPLIDEVKLYLRPMASMTEEEKDEYDRLVMCNASWVVDDWLNSHHFDYRGLIPIGSALEAPTDMYNAK